MVSVRLTKALFWISDLFAWILMSLSLLAMAYLAFLAYVAVRMPGEGEYWSKLVGSAFVALAVAAGAYGLTRRRLLSLLPVATRRLGAGDRIPRCLRRIAGIGFSDSSAMRVADATRRAR